MNLYEQQTSNRRKTWLIMCAFVGFLLLLGLGFDMFYLGASGGFAPVGSLLALGVGSVSAIVSYFTGDRAVLLATAAQPVEELEAAATDADKLKFRQLRERRRRDGDRGRFAAAARVRRARPRSQRVCDRSRIPDTRRSRSRAACSTRSIARNCRASSRTR